MKPPRRAAAALWWLAPVVFLYWLYRNGLKCWFLADDFAWLSLLQQVHSFRDLLHQMFSPMAQGTIRPWSERGFFILTQFLFGSESVPFRVIVFITAAADVLLLASITRRLTRSAVAGFFAPLLWIANASLVRPMTWSSSYNELQCGFFLLAALSLYLRYLETGERRFWWWQLVVFSLGFGALEINVVYPALALACAFFASPRSGARNILRDFTPLAGISIIYFLLHHALAPFPAQGAYAMHFDGSILKTLALYLRWSFVPEPFERFGHAHRSAIIVLWVSAAAFCAFLFTELQKRRQLVLFGLAWFAVTLAPLLPLAGHRTDYYLTLPAMGFAFIGALGISRVWESELPWRAAAAVPVLFYLWANIPVARAETSWWLDRSREVRTVVLGTVAARETHPEKTILLDGVTSRLFDQSLGQSPFVVFTVDNVYLTPESALNVHPGPNMADLDDMTIDTATMQHAITHNQVVVYSVSSDRLRNITERYSRSALDRVVVDRVPSRIEVGNALFSWLLGSEWLAPESGTRWMPGRATFKLGVPDSGGNQIELEGYCPPEQLQKAPRHLSVLIDGVPVAQTQIYDPESSFHRLLRLPESLPAGKTVEMEIRVDPVIRKDGQDFGLIFGKIAIRQ